MGAAECGDATLGGLRRREEQRADSGDMAEDKYLPELMAERDSLDPSFVHASQLLSEEIQRFQKGEKKDEEKRFLDVLTQKNIKLSERCLIPVSQFPKFNFVGKLLGPRGNSLKRLQEDTGTKMSILGKGSMRDKAKEDELRKGEEAKYAHLNCDLHVLVEVFAPPTEAYSRMYHAMEKLKKFLVPDYNDEIRQEQLTELAYLNGGQDASRGRGVRGRGAPPLPFARGRGVAPPPPSPQYGPRGAMTRGAVVRGAPGGHREVASGRGVAPAQRGAPAPRGRGTPAVYRQPLHPPPAQESYDEYGYDDGYSEQNYDNYENYYDQAQGDAEYFDYGHGEAQDTYDDYESGQMGQGRAALRPVPQPLFQELSQEDWSAGRANRKAPARPLKRMYREHPYGRY
ncbi:KH domain-containing, RNA-binding, signal transduction-associated protein 2-like isoform X2 [Leucoraja erinacea]|uniref:KH domain-containing, RNA-binding, signal transduction-associated protein 2-like isoform X2 n=1 Tax=Leucoraja erinaceus TaxID=7782 RepID=UPI00245655AE|nr:KH domain-containing, RNA-binding, signal transduction-associated protein 2-like isoform X2 [Leucoraja erinacea]